MIFRPDKDRIIEKSRFADNPTLRGIFPKEFSIRRFVTHKGYYRKRQYRRDPILNGR